MAESIQNQSKKELKETTKDDRLDKLLWSIPLFLVKIE